jgi:hypothetical protein
MVEATDPGPSKARVFRAVARAVGVAQVDSGNAAPGVGAPTA